MKARAVKGVSVKIETSLTLSGWIGWNVISSGRGTADAVGCSSGVGQ